MLRFFSVLLLLLFNCKSSKKTNTDGDNNSYFPYNYRGEFAGYVISGDSTEINDGFIYGAISEYYIDINKKILEGEILLIYNSSKDTLIKNVIDKGNIINDSLYIRAINVSDTIELKGINTYEEHYEGEWFLKNKILKGKGIFYLEKPAPTDSFPLFGISP